MILQALKEYYDRKAADPDSGIAPEGWEYKQIHFMIVLDHDGSFIRFEDTREGEGKRKRAKVYLVPRSENRSSNISANLFWDKAEYVLAGIDTDKSKTRLEQQRDVFISKIANQFGHNESAQTLIKFLKSGANSRLLNDPHWQEIKKLNPNISFRFENDPNPIFSREDIRNEFNQKINKTNPGDKHQAGVCLITGQPGLIKRTHNKTPINRKNNSLISFQKKSGYDSYNKEQGYNAPVSMSSEYAYVTALNTLLKSNQRFYVGDGTYVCWSADETNFETEFSKFFDDPQTRDNPDLFSENVKALFKSIDTGAFIENEGTQRLYLLGLSPGGGTRISVRFWDSKTVKEYAENIRRYFDELSIEKPPQYPEYFTIWRLLVNIAPHGDRENIPPKLAGDMIRAIICDFPYPETLLGAAIRRIRSGIKRKVKGGTESIERVTPEIAALVKAYLNRYYRFYPNNKIKEVRFDLDTSQTSIGYQLGRLFATLEKIQSEANNGINSTIRERFYGAACATPVTVFTNLLRLKNHHLAKLEKKGRIIYFEQLLGEIIGKIDDFPSYLNIHEQGLFAIGYYHQRQAFFTKKI